ncbi:MAG TPA: hypothetical protein VFZ66_17010 [Herpetosiphonaceae bacterium]
MQRLAIAFCLLAVFFPIALGNAAAKTPGRLDLETFIDDVVNERISPDEVNRISASLTPAQREQAWQYFYAKARTAGHTPEQKEALMRKTIEEERAAFPPQESIAPSGNASIQACDPGAAPDCWRQMVEEAAAPGGGSGSQGYYTTVDRCDQRDDTDYVFVFWYDASNPDSLRWYSTSSQVAWALGDLNGYGLSNTEVRLCVGDNSVWWAGGADWIKQTIYVKRQ